MHSGNLFFNSKKKHNYPFHKDKQDGYFPFQSENASGYDKKDLKEFYHIYPWGRYPLEINEKTKLFYELMLNLGEELLDWINFSSPKNIYPPSSPLPITFLVAFLSILSV